MCSAMSPFIEWASILAPRDAQVFAGAGWTMVRAKATVGEGVGKIREGVGFFNRGVRLLGSDVSSAGRLFYRAGAGASLKPREVRSCASAKETHASVQKTCCAEAVMASLAFLMSALLHVGSSRWSVMICSAAKSSAAPTLAQVT